MENFTLYFAKASGLIMLFYGAYQLLLKKETFFTSNRWFLLIGLFTSALLPIAVYTKVVYTDSTAITTASAVKSITLTNPANVQAIHAAVMPTQLSIEINWYDLAVGVYAIGVFFFVVRLILDIHKLRTVIKEMPYTREGRFKLMDSHLAELPFSFFSYIVYNSAKLSPSELDSIIYHEKVHSSQKHSADMLVSQLFCIAFWFNPIVWLYKKSIVQNLEFIADAETTKQISDVKAYQKTLLKITVQQDCIAITNHFYQSLIKKRIVMLNKTQSKRMNSFKYALILPLLSAFVLLFQIETMAQVKGQEDPADIVAVEIKKDMTDKEIAESFGILNKELGCNVAYSSITRNKDGLITGLEVTADGNEYSTHSDAAVNPFYIIGERTKYGIDISITAGTKKINMVAAKALVFEDTSNDPAKKNMVIKAYGTSSSIQDEDSTPDRITFLAEGTTTPQNLLGDIKEKGVDYQKAFIMIDGKQATVDQLHLLSLQPQKIGTSIVSTGNSKAIKKYGEKAKNGIVILTTQEEKSEVRTLERDITTEPSFHIAPQQHNNAVLIIKKPLMEMTFNGMPKFLKIWALPLITLRYSVMNWV